MLKKRWPGAAPRMADSVGDTFYPDSILTLVTARHVPVATPTKVSQSQRETSLRRTPKDSPRYEP